MISLLLHTTIAWALFALLYATLLRRETFFGLNRLYLLATLLIGPLLPWYLLGQPAGEGAGILPEFSAGLQQTDQMLREQSGFPGAVLWRLYLLGAGVGALRLAYGLSVLARCILRAERRRLPDGSILARSAGVPQPASFFCWILTPPDFEPGSNDQNMQAVLAHERAHARGYHSVDVLLAELACILFWFHPLAHWYRKSLRNVHEFAADRQAVQRVDRKQYGLLLLRHSAAPMPALVHHFYQSPLKRRLLMLTRGHSPTLRQWQYALILPALFLVVLGARLGRMPEAPRTAGEVQEAPAYPGGMNALMQYLSTAIRYPEAARQAGLEGRVAIQFVVARDGSVREAAVQKSVHPLLDEEALRVVRAMPRWSPGRQNGAPTRVMLTLPIKFSLE